MALRDLSDPRAVESALDEFDTLGRDEFLRKYSFGRGRDYFVVARGKLYDSKAVVGAAHGFQFPEEGPLHSSQFPGGEARVQPTLERLGFDVVNVGLRSLRRSNPFYKPAAIIAGLRVHQDGWVDAGAFRAAFAEIIVEYQPGGAEKWWEPFFHLRTDGVWDLSLGEAPASFEDLDGGRPRSEMQLTSRADRARFKGAFLIRALSDPQEMLDEADRLLQEASRGADGAVAGDAAWTRDELSACTEGYVRLLEAEAKGEQLTKATVNKELRAGPLAGRTRASVEYRMQNISAVLEEMGLRWVSGYKPAHNVGAQATSVIRESLAKLGVVSPEDFQPTDDADELDERVRRLRRRGLSREPEGNAAPATRTSEVSRVLRDTEVKAWVLQEAKGRCELCGESAPFLDRSGAPYLEVHHVVMLADGGPDTTTNAVALCPICHRRCHYSIDAPRAIEALYARVSRLKRSTS